MNLIGRYASKGTRQMGAGLDASTDWQSGQFSAWPGWFRFIIACAMLSVLAVLAVSPSGASQASRRTETSTITRQEEGVSIAINSNSRCVGIAIEPGGDRRLYIQNLCREEQEMAFCFITKAGNDNCWPMSTGSTPTPWPLRGGARHVVFKSSETTQIAVTSCTWPLKVWAVRWNGQALVGRCIDPLIPPMFGPQEDKVIPDSQDPSTWPQGNSNFGQCLGILPNLAAYSYAMVFDNRCGAPLNVFVCIERYAQASSLLHSCSNLPGRPQKFDPERYSQIKKLETGGMGFDHQLARPNEILKWSAFACPAPQIPRQVWYDGRQLQGECYDPDARPDPAPDASATGGNKANGAGNRGTDSGLVGPRLQGRWVGEFRYDEPGQPTVRFEMQLTASGNQISGTILEPNTFGDAGSPFLRARFEGGIDGSDFVFAKTYDGTGGQSHSVYYVGTLDDSETVVTGQWVVDQTTGTFELRLSD